MSATTLKLSSNQLRDYIRLKRENDDNNSTSRGCFRKIKKGGKNYNCGVRAGYTSANSMDTCYLLLAQVPSNSIYCLKRGKIL